MDEKKVKRIFVSALEPSADVHCAALIEAIKQRTGRNVEFVGFGGDNMAEAGCELIEHTTASAAMIYNVFFKIWHFVKLIYKAKKYLKNNPVELAIVCDSPAFNFHVAKAAKKNGAKTLFYVAPQLWAWASWRINKLKKCCDKLCCILPFEAKWFEDKGLEVTFVGNPLFDNLDVVPRNCRKNYESFSPKNLTLAMVPGSRDAEIKTLWRPMQQVANKLRKKYPHIQNVAVAVDQEKLNLMRSSQILGFRCRYELATVNRTCAEADFALVASGSATLQVAAAGCPMVIMYQTNKILWKLVGRWLIKTKFLSLVNILANKELVPEFMPYFDSTEPIAKAAEEIIDDSDKMGQINGELVDMAEEFNGKNASKLTAAAVLDMLSPS